MDFDAPQSSSSGTLILKCSMIASIFRSSFSVRWIWPWSPLCCCRRFSVAKISSINGNSFTPPHPGENLPIESPPIWKHPHADLDWSTDPNSPYGSRLFLFSQPLLMFKTTSSVSIVNVFFSAHMNKHGKPDMRPQQKRTYGSHFEVTSYVLQTSSGNGAGKPPATAEEMSSCYPTAMMLFAGGREGKEESALRSFPRRREKNEEDIFVTPILNQF